MELQREGGGTILILRSVLNIKLSGGDLGNSKYSGVTHLPESFPAFIKLSSLSTCRLIILLNVEFSKLLTRGNEFYPFINSPPNRKKFSNTSAHVVISQTFSNDKCFTCTTVNMLFFYTFMVYLTRFY